MAQPRLPHSAFSEEPGLVLAPMLSGSQLPVNPPPGEPMLAFGFRAQTPIARLPDTLAYTQLK